MDTKLDYDIDIYCRKRYENNDCYTHYFYPVKEDVNQYPKDEIKLYFNYSFIKSTCIEKVSTIELFFNFMSLVYLYSGVSFHFLLRKLNNLIKGTTYRLVYSTGLIVLQVCMCWQLNLIYQVYLENFKIPSIYTISSVEMLPPALSVS